jgi:two-component system, OmpR family, alkaline phosphatase synthesis response regulator PhoP
MKEGKYKILIVDDDPDILEFLSYNLEKEGYRVFTASNGYEAIDISKKEVPHLIILDVMMPEMDGIETCSEIKKNEKLKNTIITFLTARSEDYSQVVGLEAGADDYIVKPIKPKVLLSRIKALLRRNRDTDMQNSIEIGDLIIDKEKYMIIKAGKEINLPRKEFELLNLLISKPGKVFTRENILDRIWGDDVIVGDRTIDVHIRKLREKIGSVNIKTVKGIGYKFDM